MISILRFWINPLPPGNTPIKFCFNTCLIMQPKVFLSLTLNKCANIFFTYFSCSPYLGHIRAPGLLLGPLACFWEPLMVLFWAPVLSVGTLVGF